MRYKDISTLIHAFANLNDDEKFTAEGECGNVFFQHGALYSYWCHCPLARYMRTKKHGIVVIFNTKSSSVTTSSHQAQTRYAMQHHTALYVPGDFTKARDAFDNFQREAKAILSLLAKARKPIIYLEELHALQRDAERYAQVLCEKMPKELKRLFAVRDGKEYLALVEKERVARERKLKRQAVKRAKVDAENVERFRRFEVAQIYLWSGETCLRYNAAENRIETSQDVQLGARCAREFWLMIQHARRTGDYTGLLGFRLLNQFRVQNMTASHIKIGCHKIPLSEIDAIVDQLGWAMPARPVEIEG